MEDNIKGLTALGFSHNVAVALQYEGITPDEAKALSNREVLNHYLRYEGIIGYTMAIASIMERGNA